VRVHDPQLPGGVQVRDYGWSIRMSDCKTMMRCQWFTVLVYLAANLKAQDQGGEPYWAYFYAVLYSCMQFNWLAEREHPVWDAINLDLRVIGEEEAECFFGQLSQVTSRFTNKSDHRSVSNWYDSMPFDQEAISSIKSLCGLADKEEGDVGGRDTPIWDADADPSGVRKVKSALLGMINEISDGNWGYCQSFIEARVMSGNSREMLTKNILDTEVLPPLHYARLKASISEKALHMGNLLSVNNTQFAKIAAAVDKFFSDNVVRGHLSERPGGRDDSDASSQSASANASGAESDVPAAHRPARGRGRRGGRARGGARGGARGPRQVRQQRPKQPWRQSDGFAIGFHVRLKGGGSWPTDHWFPVCGVMHTRGSGTWSGVWIVDDIAYADFDNNFAEIHKFPHTKMRRIYIQEVRDNTGHIMSTAAVGQQ